MVSDTAMPEDNLKYKLMKSILFGLAILAFSVNALAQIKPVKIVFDVTSKDTLIHQATMRHVQGMSSAYPESDFEVVVYGGALSMLLKESSTVSEGINSLFNNEKVSFKVCAQTMKKYDAHSTSLLSGVDIVPDGIIEIVTRQGEGWGYIKETN